MNIKKVIPPSIRAGYKALMGIPFTKGYDKKYDKNYSAKSKDYIKYQSVKKNTHKIETDIEVEKGLAVKTREKKN